MMLIDSRKYLRISNISLLFLLIGFNILNFFDKLTTYFGMNFGFVEMNDKASYYFSTIGLSRGIFLQFFVAMIGGIIIYYAMIKFLKLLSIRIPVILGWFYITINYLLAVISNIHYLVVYR